MATQGVLSFVDREKKTIVKIVTGSDGIKILPLANSLIRDANEDDGLTLEHVFDVAAMYLGKKSLVVMSAAAHLTECEEKLGEVYRRAFDDPFWNPRWEYGTADYCMVIVRDILKE